MICIHNPQFLSSTLSGASYPGLFLGYFPSCSLPLLQVSLGFFLPSPTPNPMSKRNQSGDKTQGLRLRPQAGSDTPLSPGDLSQARPGWESHTSCSFERWTLFCPASSRGLEGPLFPRSPLRPAQLYKPLMEVSVPLTGSMVITPREKQDRDQTAASSIWGSPLPRASPSSEQSKVTTCPLGLELHQVLRGLCGARKHSRVESTQPCTPRQSCV